MSDLQMAFGCRCKKGKQYHMRVDTSGDGRGVELRRTVALESVCTRCGETQPFEATAEGQTVGGPSIAELAKRVWPKGVAGKDIKARSHVRQYEAELRAVLRGKRGAR